MTAPQSNAPSKLTKPIGIIVVAVVLAAAAGFFLTYCASGCSIFSVPGASHASSSPAPPPGGGHSRGPEKAEITLVEYGDYQCPACGMYYPVVEEVLRRFPNQIRFEFHHFPLINLHRNAMAAAMAAEAAADQNHFWEMHDLLYRHQDEWSKAANPDPIFLSYATQLGLDPNKFMQSVRSAAVDQRISQDVIRAQEAKIPQTPTFFLNGQMITTPKTVGDFTALIASRLDHK